MARNWLRGNAAWHQKRTTQPKWSKKKTSGRECEGKKPIAKLVDAFERRVRTKHSERTCERERRREFCNLWWLTKWFISVVYWPFNWIFHLILFGRCSFFLSGSPIHLSICLFRTDSLLLSLAGHLNHGTVCFFSILFSIRFCVLCLVSSSPPSQLPLPMSMILISFIGKKINADERNKLRETCVRKVFFFSS